MEITVQTVVFYFLAFFIALTSILTVTTQRIVRSATYLLFTLFATAGIYFCWAIRSSALFRWLSMQVVSWYYMYSPFC
jgi:NADH:ubiquinone oxidoreductase subunit 6 (subunit J)